VDVGTADEVGVGSEVGIGDLDGRGFNVGGLVGTGVNVGGGEGRSLVAVEAVTSFKMLTAVSVSLRISTAGDGESKVET
jgi:hypothetical protein